MATSPATSRPTPRNLVFVSSGLGIGGAETMLYRLATRIDPARFKVAVVSLGEKGAIGARLESAGIPVVALGLARGRLPWHGARRLLDAVRGLEADLLQGWMYHGNLAATVAGWLTHAPCTVLWSVRQCLDDPARERALTRAVVRACARVSWQPDAVIYNSRVSRAQHEALGFQADRSVVVPNGFELSHHPHAKPNARRRLGIPVDHVLVGLVARADPCKGHDCFVKAAQQVARHYPDVRFVMAGRGVDAHNQRLGRLLASLGMTDRVRLLGEQQDSNALFASLDVLCMASVWGDSFPNVLGEAMAAGVPCVTTDVGDAAEIVGGTGLTVKPGDPRSLALAIEQMVRLGSGARAALGAAARLRIARRYGLAKVVEQYEEIYEEVSGHVRNRRAVPAGG